MQKNIIAFHAEVLLMLSMQNFIDAFHENYIDPVKIKYFHKHF
jgi:hypothetical protein